MHCQFLCDGVHAYPALKQGLLRDSRKWTGQGYINSHCLVTNASSYLHAVPDLRLWDDWEAFPCRICLADHKLPHLDAALSCAQFHCPMHPSSHYRFKQYAYCSCTPDFRLREVGVTRAGCRHKYHGDRIKPSICYPDLGTTDRKDVISWFFWHLGLDDVHTDPASHTHGQRAGTQEERRDQRRLIVN